MPIQEVNSNRTREQHSKDSRKGGIKSGEARRNKKTIREYAQLVMDLPVVGGNRNMLMNLGIKEEDLNSQWTLVMVGLSKKAMQGDTKATKLLMELNEKSREIELKEKELELKERELKLKEELLTRDSTDERVTIINDLYEGSKD